MTTSEKLIVRTSDRGMFRSCRQHWDFTSKVRMNYEPIKKPHYFEFGSAIHAGLEEYYDPDFWDMPADHRALVAAQAFKEHTKGQRKEAAKAFPDNMLPDEMKEEYAERIQLGMGMLKHYGQWAPRNDNFRPIFTEIEFEVPVPDYDSAERNHLYINNKPVYYQGRIDLIVATDDGEQYVLDHKTAARFDSIEHVDLDTQISSYVWAGMQMGIKLDGFIYSRLRKAAPEPPSVNKHRRKGRILSVSKSQSTTYDLMLEAIHEYNEPVELYEEYLDWLKTQGSDEYFDRHVVNRTPAEIDYQGRMIFEEAMDMFYGRDGQGPAIYPNPSQWNCRGCAFRTPCLARQEDGDVQYILDNLGLYFKRD